MAKATEWVQRFDTAPNLGDELAAFMAEIGEVARARGNTPNAVEGAVREQKVKFRAVCERTTRVNMGLWDAMMKTHGAAYIPDINAFLRTCGPKPARTEKDWRRKNDSKPSGKPARAA